MVKIAESPLAPKKTPNLKPIDGIKLYAINNGISGSLYQNRENLSLVVCTPNTSVAGVFTQSSAASANVVACKRNLKSKEIRAFITHAGNSNAFTGQSGVDGVDKQERSLSRLLKCKPEQIFTSATGVIGEYLDTEKYITSQLETLLNNECSWNTVAKAITTTDTFIKCATASFSNKMGEEITINGIAKGSGMIAPNMATMIAFIATNAQIDSNILQDLLNEVNEESFNSTTVDSDTSTSDTVILTATNKTKVEDLTEFKKALEEVMHDLARQLAKDGEGATKFVTVNVTQAATKNLAKKIARSIADSPLVKTAIAGEDPNWGRIVMAIGKASSDINLNKLSINLGNIELVKNGEKVSSYKEEDGANYMKEQDIVINVSLCNGSEKSHIYTCDLTKQYIAINADYRS